MLKKLPFLLWLIHCEQIGGEDVPPLRLPFTSTVEIYWRKDDALLYLYPEPTVDAACEFPVIYEEWKLAQ